MGATRVRIGDFEVCFEPSAPSAVPDSLKDEPDESPLERQKRFDKTLFRSSG